MKKINLLIVGLALSSFALAQSNVYLKISHKLNGSAFSTSAVGTNSEGDDFTVNRLQYYMSGIKLIHDGGQETAINNVYFLVNAKNLTNLLLGTHNVTSLESIKFSIGVDSSTNHLDPSSYNSSHPLAPKSPSMHWGWSAGYRFIALEGKSNSQKFELHGLGDVNYFEQTITTSGAVNGADLTIHLQGDYEGALKDITLSSGVISHGETGAAKTALNNFKTDVFSEYKEEVVVVDGLANSINNTFEIYPNPTNGSKIINLNGNWSNGIATIQNITGSVIISKNISGKASINISDLNTGIYFVKISTDNTNFITEKLIIK